MGHSETAAAESPPGTPVAAEFGRRIRDARQRAGLTQKFVARKAEIDVTALSKIETGRRSVKVDDALLDRDLNGARNQRLSDRRQREPAVQLAVVGGYSGRREHHRGGVADRPAGYRIEGGHGW